MKVSSQAEACDHSRLHSAVAAKDLQTFDYVDLIHEITSRRGCGVKFEWWAYSDHPPGLPESYQGHLQTCNQGAESVAIIVIRINKKG